MPDCVRTMERLAWAQTAALDGTLLETALQATITTNAHAVAPVELDERIRAAGQPTEWRVATGY